MRSDIVLVSALGIRHLRNKYAAEYMPIVGFVTAEHTMTAAMLMSKESGVRTWSLEKHFVQVQV